MRAARLVQVDRELAEEHYAEHAEKPFFGELVEFITSAPTLALVLEGESAIAVVRTTMGATNPADVGARARSAATSRWRCRTTSCTARTRRSRRSARSRSGSAVNAPELTEHAAQNRECWDAERRVPGAARARSSSASRAWGMWQIPEAELQRPRRRRRQGRARARLRRRRSGRSLLARRRRPRRSASTTRRAQLEHARAANEAAGLEFPLVHASAEAIPLAGRELRRRLLPTTAR